MILSLRLFGLGLILIGVGGFGARPLASHNSFILAPWITPVLLVVIVAGMCVLLRYSAKLPLAFRKMNDKLDIIEKLVEKK